MKVNTKYFKTDKALISYFNKHTEFAIVSAYLINGYICAIYYYYDEKVDKTDNVSTDI